MINRIKYILPVLITGIVYISANAEKKPLITADPFPDERPGQYVYYHDMRSGIYGVKEPVNRLIGMMKAENKVYIFRVFNIKDGKSYMFTGHFVLKNGIMEFSPETIQGDNKDGAFILADLLNLISYMGGETIRHTYDFVNKKDITANSTWADYNRKLTNSFRWWLPFYKLESSSNTESDKFGEKGYTSLMMVCFGAVSTDDYELFIRINKLPVYHKNRIDEKKFLIPAAERMTVKLNDVSLNLDKNWRFEKGNTSMEVNDSYTLKKYTKRDAQIGVESIETNTIKLEKNIIETFISTLKYQTCVIPETVSTDLINNTLSLSLWDAESGTSTFVKYRSLGVKRNLLTMLNFSAIDVIYYSNMDYFNTILNGIFNN